MLAKSLIAVPKAESGMETPSWRLNQNTRAITYRPNLRPSSSRRRSRVAGLYLSAFDAVYNDIHWVGVRGCSSEPSINGKRSWAQTPSRLVVRTKAKADEKNLRF